jgi:hypothetical protein
MMIGKIAAAGAALSLAATPCLAAELHTENMSGERRSGAVAGGYFSVPFGGKQDGKPQAGLRLQMAHDYRDAVATNAPMVKANAFELRLLGDKKPTFYAADMALTGEEAEKRNLMGGGIIGLAIVAGAIVGAVLVVRMLTDENDAQCLDPAICD